MKNTIKKFGVLVVAFATVLAMTTTAFASTAVPGEQGAFTEKDTPTTQAKEIVFEKELTAYNKDEAKVNAPEISYTYTIAPATVEAGTQVTDNADKHESNSPVTVPVSAGVTTGLSATTATITWTNADQLDAADDGAANKKEVKLNFENVVFPKTGIYRYVITEALTTGYAYASSGVTEGSSTDKTRYMDVYVKPSSTYTDGTNASDWDIYGFTCFINNTSITDADKTTNAVKVDGFTEHTENTTGTETTVNADSYYTYNLTVEKEVKNDGYGAATVAFPFTVIFTNSTITRNIDIAKASTTTATGWNDPESAALSAGTTKGIVNIKSGQKAKFVGIPNGTSVEVYETNTATGVTYSVTTALTTNATTTTTDDAVTWAAAPTTAEAQAAEKAASQSTKATFTTTANEDDNNAYAVKVTNTLVTISPTGVVLRIAPYALILGAGILLLLLARRRKTEKEAYAA